ncbi:unnamed protein product [Tuber melanosporum]|uniref:(Perigord truffle) hypothetical protein n=1 Tax=Tuber melanosporum (strain Mel28) TaxID=656061 RepID=D5GLR2_TUBMM|nr:uncharacterized protein GSTUM_00010367001 [Tuber melanosporum]CAZ85479.1 unnamed protein product [Tuber melanosporum]
MSSGRRRLPHPTGSGKDFLLPLALTLTTAAIATAGLYFWPGSDTPWTSPHESEDEVEAGGRSRKSRRHQYFDRITEEDTDDLIEDAGRDEKVRKEKSSHRHNTGSTRHSTGSSSTMMAGALVVDRIEHAVGKAADLLPGTSERKKAEALREIKKEAEEVSKKQQYVPMPTRKKSVAIVVSERKVLFGQDSDLDFEEAGLPSSLLSHLPHPLDLTHTVVNILVYSPQLKTHPLSKSSAFRSQHAAAAAAAVVEAPVGSSDKLLHKPSASHFSPTASTFTLASSMLPSECPLEHILPFTQASSIVPLLRTLAPETVYIEEPLTLPTSGGIVSTLLEGRWVGNVVVGLIGDDDQLAQLMDSDDEKMQEEEKTRKGEGKWWGTEVEGSIRGRFGNRVQIVEGWVLIEDWRRRVEERS